MNTKKTMYCMICMGHKIKKNGKLTSQGQRYRCGDCKHSFSVGGIRGTYDPKFKDHIAQQYCHRHHKAQDIVRDYGISTATLIKRSKSHKSTCTVCQS